MFENVFFAYSNIKMNMSLVEVPAQRLHSGLIVQSLFRISESPSPLTPCKIQAGNDTIHSLDQQNYLLSLLSTLHTSLT